MNTILHILKDIKDHKVHFLIVLTLFLMLINHLFYIDDFIAIPQFAHFDHWQYCQKEIKGIKEIYYWTFFIGDFIWSFFLLWNIYGYIVNYCCYDDLQTKYKGTIVSFLTDKWTYINLFTFTWLFDVIENISYLVLKDYKSVSEGFLPGIVKTKIILYTVCAVIFLISLYKSKIGNDEEVKKNIIDFIKSSFLSIAFLVVIAALLTQMEQGSSLIIALLDSPFNLFLVSFMLVVLSIVFSHYPIYFLFYKYYKNIQDDNIWVRLEGCCSGGIIKFDGEYQTEKGNKLYNNIKEEWKYSDEKFRPYRYFLGALVFVSFAYALLFTLDKYIIQPGITSKAILLMIAALFGLKYYFFDSKTSNNQLVSPVSYLSIYGISWASIISALICSYICGWHWSTFILFLMFLFSRSLHAFLNTKNKDLCFPDGFKNSLIKVLAQIHHFEFGKEKSYIDKLTFIKWTGFLALFIFIISHIPTIGMELNPIIIILCYVHFSYGFILILLKNYMYYTSKITAIDFSRSLAFLSKNILIVLVIVFGLKWYWNRNHNEIQYLKEYSFDKNETIEIDTFLSKYFDVKTDDSVRYYIASWGGGLRATYFNLLYLDKKQKESGNQFLNKVVAMSGVSGGSLGLNLLFSTKKENEAKHYSLVSDIYDNIGNGNFASTDIAYLLGRDRLPFNQWLSRDRSIVGMNNYWSIITSPCTPFDTTAYQTYWKEGVNRLGYFPLLITNTTKTSGNYGVAFSAYADPEKFNQIFKGATNILDLKKDTMSLSFYEAMSTTERFPFFSATASIKGQGHYIDGGYFENSGILSLINLRHYINQKEPKRKTKDVLIILGNSKSNLIDFYITKLQKDSIITIKIAGETDYGAIIKGVLDTDRLGNYLSDHHGIHSDSAILINLPYHIRYNDFVKALGGKPQDSMDIATIRKKIKENNDAVDKAINDYVKSEKPNTNRRKYALSKWDFAYPTLSRYLSRPTVNYYKAMFKYHPHLQ